MTPRFFPRVEAKRLVDAVAVLAKQSPERLRLSLLGPFDWCVSIYPADSECRQPDAVIDRKDLPFWQRRRLLRIARACNCQNLARNVQ